MERLWQLLLLMVVRRLVVTAGAAKTFAGLSTTEVSALLPKVRGAWVATAEQCRATSAATASGTCSLGSSGSSGSLACQDAAVLPPLKLLYEGPEVSGAFLDVGAHVGRWAAELLSLFGTLERKKYAKEFGSDWERCKVHDTHSVAIYCFEPVAASFDRLKDRAKRSGWLLENMNFMRAGIANASGKADIWALAGSPDAAASLSPRKGASAKQEKMVTIDLLLKKTVATGKAFLVRLAVNGHEHSGLLGAKKSLKARSIRFILFEVSPLWAQAGYHLRASISFLWKVGYACFALLAQPVPVSGPFWNEEAITSGPDLFHTLCGHVEDPGFRQAIRILNVDGPDYLKQKVESEGVAGTTDGEDEMVL